MGRGCSRPLENISTSVLAGRHKDEAWLDLASVIGAAKK